MEETESAKRRCNGVIEMIEKLPLTTNVITPSCRRTLLKLAQSELNFLSSLLNPNQTLSVNIGHLEAVLHILHHPCISAVSRVCRPAVRDPNSSIGTVHVDIVCNLNGNPVWIVVSDRNPSYVAWNGCDNKNKGLKSRVEQVLSAAKSTRILRPSSVIFFFARGIPVSVRRKLRDEFGASEFDFSYCEEVESGWVKVPSVSYTESVSLEIKLGGAADGFANRPTLVFDSETARGDQDDPFSLLLSTMKLGYDGQGGPNCESLVNFDTTALIALVSGISNGCADKLLATPEIDLKKRFKGNVEFVIAQVISELENPMLVELSGVVSGKRGIICESVLSEFKELVLMCGGPNEKNRCDRLLKYLVIVPDNPSERMMGLPTTRKLAVKNKVVFGTGDYWHAPTLTANAAFVRAVTQTGMSLSTVEHKPRALTGTCCLLHPTLV